MVRWLTAGESHGPCLTAILEGLPAGLKLDEEAINRDLARRQQGYGRGGSYYGYGEPGYYQMNDAQYYGGQPYYGGGYYEQPYYGAPYQGTYYQRSPYGPYYGGRGY